MIRLSQCANLLSSHFDELLMCYGQYHSIIFPNRSLLMEQCRIHERLLAALMLLLYQDAWLAPALDHQPQESRRALVVNQQGAQDLYRNLSLDISYQILRLVLVAGRHILNR